MADKRALASRFKVTIDGHQVPNVTEVSGLTLEMDVVETTDTKDGKILRHRLPGLPKAGNITLTRNLQAAQMGLEKWMDATFHGLPAGSTLAVEIFDSGGDEVRTLNFTFGMIKSIEISALKAGDANVGTEKATIEHTGASLPIVDLILG